MWMAGGGVKGTVVSHRQGRTQGHRRPRLHINDIHATILHLMGIGHKQLTFLHNGRDERSPTIGGRVLEGLLACILGSLLEHYE
jgi:hypothetical protein